jgi:hypothetical protein
MGSSLEGFDVQVTLKEGKTGVMVIVVRHYNATFKEDGLWQE